MATVNFTGSVDRDLLKRAKVIAAKTDTSVNALFNAELRHLVLRPSRQRNQPATRISRCYSTFRWGASVTTRPCRRWASTARKTCFC